MIPLAGRFDVQERDNLRVVGGYALHHGCDFLIAGIFQRVMIDIWLCGLVFLIALAIQMDQSNLQAFFGKTPGDMPGFVCVFRISTSGYLTSTSLDGAVALMAPHHRDGRKPCAIRGPYPCSPASSAGADQ